MPPLPPVYQAYNPENDGDSDREGTEVEHDGDVEDDADEDIALSGVGPSTLKFRSDDHFILGSPQGVHTIKYLLRKNPDDTAFTNFCSRLSVAIKNLDPTNAIIVDKSHKVCCLHQGPRPTLTITVILVGVYRFLRVYYESTVDWS